MKKYKIITISDAPIATSGVAISAGVLFRGLLNTGKYEIKSIGSAIKHPSYETISPLPDWIIKPTDGFADRNIIRQIIATEKPSALFIFTDPRFFMHVFEMEDEIHQVCPIVYWSVWDAPPKPIFNNVLYDSTDLLNCISWLTYEMLSEDFPDRTNYVPHAFPKNMYYPLPQDKINELKAKHFGPRKDWFTALWVNRNAHRKQPGELIQCWKMFLDLLQEREGHKNAILLMHTDPVDVEGTNLPYVADYFGVTDNIIFSPQKVGFEEMNMIHNMSDVTVTISRAEGFGMGACQSMQVGKPIIAGKTGGLTRQVVDWRDGSEHGVALNVVKRALNGSLQCPMIYDDFFSQTDVAEAFYKIFKMTPEEKEAMSEKVRKYVDFEFNYDRMIADWDRTLTETIEKWKQGKLPNNKKWVLKELTGKLNSVNPNNSSMNIQNTIPIVNIPNNNGGPTISVKRPKDIKSLISSNNNKKDIITR